MKPRVSILILSTNQAERLRECLAALAADGSTTPREVILVLNDAISEVRAVAAAAPARVIDSPVNLGVPGGYNRARTVASGEFLALIHDDTAVAPGWLEQLVATLDRRPEAGAAGGLVFEPNGNLQNAGSIMWQDGWARSLWWGAVAPPAAAFVETDFVHTVGSSFTLVRADAFDRAGGLDESLHPGYFVDITLGMCIREMGQVVLLDPAARAVHHRGASSSVAYRHFIVDRNHARFCARWRATLEAEHIPFVDTPQGYHDARERARQQALAIAARRRWETAPPPPPFALDARAQELRLLAAEAATRKAWAAALEGQLAAVSAERDALAARVRPLRKRMIAPG